MNETIFSYNAAHLFDIMIVYNNFKLRFIAF